MCQVPKRKTTRVTTRPANTSLVISTLPYRHNLPGDDGTNQVITLVNAYIQELAVRHDTRFLDFNKLDRKIFTRHGMHLPQRGKRKLAGLIERSLAKMHKLTLRPSTNVPPPSSGEPPSSTLQSPSVATAELQCLPMLSPEPLPHSGPLCATQSSYTLDITPQQLRGGSAISTSIRTLYSCCS
ncbi:hypothetical protein J6590_076632 [Homalodisca vitripennis]|nr:hypothetical protein J6590_076632 [Homalodisca vitripennis]